MRTPQDIPILPISINLDLSFKGNVEGTLESFRDAIYTNAINLAGDYDPAFAYKYNYMVKYGGELYLCIKDCTGIAPGNLTYWDKVSEKGKSLVWRGAYSHTTAYQILDLVFYNNSVYICIQNSTGHYPSDANYWRLISQGVVFKGAYSAATTYYPNDIVSYNGSSYGCIQQTLNHLPTDTTYWVLMAQAGDLQKSVFDAHLAEITTYQSNLTDKEIYPEIIDMHYKALKGMGFNALEAGESVIKYISAPAAKGTYEITLPNVTSLVANQLCVYYDGVEYYTSIIKSISGNVVTLNKPLETALEANDLFFNFYDNSYHPNAYGKRAIIDETLRNIVKPRGHKLLMRFLPSEFTYSAGMVVADGGFQQDYTEPFAVFDTKVATNDTGTKYCMRQFTLAEDGHLNFKTNLTISGDLRLLYRISDVGGTVVYAEKTVNLGDTYPEVVEMSAFLKKGTYILRIALLDVPGSIALGKTDVYEIDFRYNIETLNNGVHLLLGDSWFDETSMQLRFETRLPKATFINFGVGGNQLDNLYRRFTGTATDADIKNDPTNYGDRKDATTIPKIDYVWVMCGTNDYASGDTVDVYKANMDLLINAIMDRGAKPLVFTSSVGQVGVDTEFTLSRQYADLYYNQQYKVNTQPMTTFTPTIVGATTAGTHTYNIQEGFYYIIDKILFFELRVRISVKDAAMAGAVRINGLPKSPAKLTPVQLGQTAYVAYGTSKQLYAQAETTGQISIMALVDDASAVAIDSAATKNNTMFVIAGSFITA